MADCDGDGYYHDGDLRVDVDVSSGTHSIYLVLEIKNSTLTTYQPWSTTECFSITGNSRSDYYTFVHPFPYDVRGKYDFRVTVYTCSGTRLTYNDQSHDPQLNDWPVERDYEDIASSVWVSSAYWTNSLDYDLNGYTRSRKLNFVVNSSCDTWIGFELWYQCDGLLCTWGRGWTRSSYNIESGIAKTISIDISGLSHDCYDFRIKLFTTDFNHQYGEYDDSDDGDLNDECFELSGED